MTSVLSAVKEPCSVLCVRLTEESNFISKQRKAFPKERIFKLRPEIQVEIIQ